VIVRPTGPGFSFRQLDGLAADQLARPAPAVAAAGDGVAGAGATGEAAGAGATGGAAGGSFTSDDLSLRNRFDK
jgi:hypothetical protein